MITKKELATAIVTQVFTSGEARHGWLMHLQPSPSRTPAFAETPVAYIEWLVKSRTRPQLLRLIWNVLNDPALDGVQE